MLCNTTELLRHNRAAVIQVQKRKEKKEKKEERVKKERGKNEKKERKKVALGHKKKGK